MIFLKYLFNLSGKPPVRVEKLKWKGKESDEAIDEVDVNIKKSANELVENAEKEESINEKLLKIKEFNYLYTKTKIPPIIFAYLLISLFVLMVIGYLENLLTLLVGLIYPIYISIKSMRERNREKIRHWLKYWIVFSLFLNFEGVFSYFLDDIPLYFFYKVVFLLICFLPYYNGAKYFYENLIKHFFVRYENEMYDISVKWAKKIKTTLLEDIDEEKYDSDD